LPFIIRWDCCTSAGSGVKGRSLASFNCVGFNQDRLFNASQAVATWKDLGSAVAASEYVQNLNQGVVNISFSTAGLVALPDMGRLPYLESVAACFNSFGDPSSVLNLSTLPPYLKVSPDLLIVSNPSPVGI